MHGFKCRICGEPTQILFHSPSSAAIMSSARLVQGCTDVDFCLKCGHAQTRPILDLDAYYSTEYRFQLASKDQDEVYEHQGGRNVYRSQRQTEISLGELRFEPGMNVLDYGCGKASSLREIAGQVGGIRPFVFDVSDAYRALWDEFVPQNQQACFDLPPSWKGQMDVVLSFFALEHVAEPHEFMDVIEGLLRPGGKFVCIVPDVRHNVSDLLVVDHVNHFSAASIDALFSRHGLHVLKLDDSAFRGGFLVIATKSPSAVINAKSISRAENVLALRAQAQSLIDGLARVRAAEAVKALNDKTIVYGSGVYGLFMAGHLRDHARFLGFIDQNPFRQGLTFFERPVTSPEDVPDEAKLVFVGLNPRIARGVIEGVDPLHRVSRSFVYLAP